WRERTRIDERAGVSERRRKLRAGSGRVNQALDPVLPLVCQQHIAIARIDSESRDTEKAGKPHEWDRVGAIVAERPDMPAHVVTEHVRSFELRKVVASINNAARNRIALVRRRPMTIRLDRYPRAETCGGAG